MTESTITTDEVRDSWLGEPGRYYLFGPTVEEFDRWLEDERAKAWNECYELWATAPAGDFPDRRENPYRSAEVLD